MDIRDVMQTSQVGKIGIPLSAFSVIDVAVHGLCCLLRRREGNRFDVGEMIVGNEKHERCALQARCVPHAV